MDKLFIYIITCIFIIAVAKLTFTYIKNYIKARKFFKQYFSEDRLYNISELSSAFNLDIETMKNVLGMLEKAFVFKKLNSLGTTMDKDYFSKYEIKMLVKMLVKKNKLL